MALIALLSGGLDSGTALALAHERKAAIAACVTFDYGQRAAARELDAAARLARRFEAPWRRIDLPWLGELAAVAGCALVAKGRALPQGTRERPGDAASASAVWVPARNAVFLAVAAAIAETIGAATLIAGFNREEAATFPDNSPAFVAAATAFLRHGTANGVTVESPTLHLGKREIAAEARRLGLVPADFWSCYAEGPDPCGRCESCLRSRW